jgi:hypothetical protein
MARIATHANGNGRRRVAIIDLDAPYSRLRRRLVGGLPAALGEVLLRRHTEKICGAGEVAA